MYASGSMMDLDILFGGKLKVDQSLRDFLTSENFEWEVRGLGLDVLRAEKGVSDDDIACSFAVRNDDNSDVTFIFACLAHLDSTEGEKILAIPEGEDETDVIICYIGDDVVYLEHEHEEGEDEEWHLHKRSKKSVWNRAPKVVVVFPRPTE